MKLTINSKEFNFKKPRSIEKILQDLKVLKTTQACAVNMKIVKRKDWSTFCPKDGDKLELLDFVGGG